MTQAGQRMLRRGPVLLGQEHPAPSTLTHACSCLPVHTLHTATGRNPDPEIAVSPLEAECLWLAVLPRPGEEAGRGRLQQSITAQGACACICVPVHTYPPTCTHICTNSYMCTWDGEGQASDATSLAPEG